MQIEDESLKPNAAELKPRSCSPITKTRRSPRKPKTKRQQENTMSSDWSSPEKKRNVNIKAAVPAHLLIYYIKNMAFVYFALDCNNVCHFERYACNRQYLGEV